MLTCPTNPPFFPPAASRAGSRSARSFSSPWRCISARGAAWRRSRRPPQPPRSPRPPPAQPRRRRASRLPERMTAHEIRVTLPDGSERRMPAGATSADLARAIGPGLAKAAVAARVDGQVWDLARPLPDGAKVAILTDKDPQALEVLRHSSAHVRRLEEAKKRDHRMLGKQLDLFSIQEDTGPGLIFWHPKGAMVQFQLRRFIEDTILERGYQLVYTPHVTREQLFLRSGHLPLYADNQFPAMAAGEGEAEDVRYRVKPMNCPMHILVYAAQQRSYRDLPIRLAEIANVYRNERSGTLHGMLRVRGLTMDDAHIFLREDQIEQEIFELLDIVELVMGKTFGLQYRLDLATRPDKKLGDDKM